MKLSLDSDRYQAFEDSQVSGATQWVTYCSTIQVFDSFSRSFENQSFIDHRFAVILVGCLIQSILK